MNANPTVQVAIVGAGPYGLAAAAHLRAAKIETQVFGEAMEFWKKQMPAGMLLRSPWSASQISDPERKLRLDDYETAQMLRVSRPIPVEDFVRYGRWFARQAVPDLDPRRVSKVESVPRGFQVTLEDGEPLRAERVVVATGIAKYAWRPALFDGLPSALASHPADHADLGRFAGQSVAIVGGGQSALESAALLHEIGAQVEVIARQETIRWLDQKARWLKSPSNPLRPLLYPPTDVGPPILNQIVAAPNLFRRLPLGIQEKIAYRSIRPAGAGWLVNRLSAVPIRTSRTVVSAARTGDRVALRLDDGSERTVDHVLIATGYRIDISRNGLLSNELLGRLQIADGYPLLTAGLESASVPGLHFIGAPAARSYGPLCRFVSGGAFAAGALTRRIARGRSSAPVEVSAPSVSPDTVAAE